MNQCSTKRWRARLGRSIVPVNVSIASYFASTADGALLLRQLLTRTETFLRRLVALALHDELIGTDVETDQGAPQPPHHSTERPPPLLTFQDYAAAPYLCTPLHLSPFSHPRPLHLFTPEMIAWKGNPDLRETNEPTDSLDKSDAARISTWCGSARSVCALCIYTRCH
ncbi:hypothetical protein NSPZN2_80016 [Nitrospira defluvii]|uniref:Uncharacterized protein n=1 Tax=Nitrospira defluvii TaxID=330214 RepID=A0ABM8SBR6_9BACT|nr:hypothetical protein NSPZN2_80016 [Nitrospira defluvii]